MMQKLTGFQRDLLYAIHGLDDPYGLEIKRALEEYHSEEVNHGRLYPNLDTLVELGLVEKSEKDKRTNLYRLSDKALEVINERRAWEDQQLKAEL